MRLEGGGAFSFRFVLFALPSSGVTMTLNREVKMGARPLTASLALKIKCLRHCEKKTINDSRRTLPLADPSYPHCSQSLVCLSPTLR